MRIDRTNYEEYFLLYIDNELNVEQKGQVEVFVRDNPDLGEELVMLQQSKLSPDQSLVFDEKAGLLREENRLGITMENFEEWLILDIDDELTEGQKAEVEKFATVHPRVGQDLGIFRQTKLQPEKIVFAHKEVLYKKERAAVISLQWWKIAVAAILIIAAGITFYSISSKKTSGDAAHRELVQGTRAAQSPVVSRVPTQGTPAVVKPADEQKTIASSIQVKEVKKTKKLVGPIQENIQKQEPNNQTLVVVSDALMPQSGSNESSDVKTPQLEMSSAIVSADNIHKEIINGAAVTNVTAKTPPIVYASNAENKKLRGFFRKAARLIERTTNINPVNDDNRVLVGAMAFNLK